MKMTRKRIALEDGRYLIYFSFGDRRSERTDAGKRARSRRSGVRRRRD